MNSYWTGLGLAIVLVFFGVYFAAAPTVVPPLKIGKNDTYTKKAIDDYGEPASIGKVKEPECFWSALAFILVGLVVFVWMDLSTPIETRRLMSVPSVYSIPLAVLMVWLGPGSMLEHGMLLKSWGWFDSTSVHWYAIFVTEYLVFRLIFDHYHLTKGWVLGLFWGIFAGSCAGVGALTWDNDHARLPFTIGLMALLGLLLLLLGIGKQFWSPNVLQRAWKWLTPAAALTYVGILLQLTAGPMYECRKIPLFHAAWHVHIALATLFIYMYLRSEVIVDNRNDLNLRGGQESVTA